MTNTGQRGTIIKKALKYLQKFGKCPGCKRRLKVWTERTYFASPFTLRVECPKCKSQYTDFCADNDTVAQIVARVSKHFYTQYQMKIVARLRGEE
jgi:hydrogenase maturation factor HypF (carbamoyltransferase family)